VSEPLSTGPKGAEAGFTLVELIVYISLSVLILSLVGGFLLNGVRAERGVTSAAQAANTAQLIAESIKRDVRNATEVNVSDNHNLLVVKTVGMGEVPDSTCGAWFFDEETQAIYAKKAGAKSEPMTDDLLASWTAQGQGISRINPTEPVGVFTAVDGSVSLSFTVSGVTPVVVKTSVTARLLIDTEGTCFAD
jgi:type II secretory pathway pseudopilin PulG